MGAKCAELVFIAGPQKGERVWITAKTMILGRMPRCDICLKEDFVSRQHARMEISADGVIIENLSSNGTLINDKRYKAGKKLLLATGDVVGMGMETRLLFVGVGDDAEAALAEYRNHEESLAPAPAPELKPADNAVPAVPAPGAPAVLPAAQASPTVQAPAPAKAPALTTVPPPLPGKVPAKTPAAAPPKTAKIAQGPTEEPVAQSAEKTAAQKKLRKYMKFGIVYAAVLVAVVVVIKFAPKTSSPDTPVSTDSGFLTREDIASILRQKPDRKLNAVEADKALTAAVELFPRRKADPGNLYKVVSGFQYYLSAKEGAGVFEQAEHDTMYRQALDEMVEAVASKYENAYGYERNHDYRTAKILYTSLLEMLPVGTRGPVQDKLVKNIMEHLSSVSKKVAR